MGTADGSRGRMTTTGVASDRWSAGSASTAAASFAGLVASVSSTAGAPVSSWARAVRFCAPDDDRVRREGGQGGRRGDDDEHVPQRRPAGEREGSDAVGQPAVLQGAAAGPGGDPTQQGGAEQPDGQGQQHRGEQGGGALDVAGDDAGQREHGDHDDDDVEHPEATPGGRRHAAEQGRHRLAQHGAGREVDGDEAGDDGHAHRGQPAASAARGARPRA